MLCVDSLVYFFMFSLSDIKLVDKFSYFPTVCPNQPASFSENQKYCFQHPLLSSMFSIAESTSDVEADNWSGRFFSPAQQRQKRGVGSLRYR